MPKNYNKLPIFLPDLSNYKGITKITWTISTLAQLNPNDVDSYTSNCIEDFFYPNDNHYSYTSNSNGVRITKNAFEGSLEAKSLLDHGFVQSKFPISKPPKNFANEEELRSGHLKWDTIAKKSINIRLSSLNNPFFILHGINRDTEETALMKYYVAITVEIPKYKGILCDDVLARYRNLIPITIKAENQLFVEI